MRALVMYESMFGNTRDIANALAGGMSAHLEVEVVEVSAAPATVGDDVDLLVVGGPTHAHGMSNPGSRASRESKDRGCCGARPPRAPTRPCDRKASG